MNVKNCLIAGVLLATAFAVVPSGAEAQSTWRERVCSESRDYAREARREMRTLIRANRTILQGTDLTTRERRELRMANRQLRARRQMLKYVLMRIDNGRPTARQCRRLDVYTTRVASLA